MQYIPVAHKPVWACALAESARKEMKSEKVIQARAMTTPMRQLKKKSKKQNGAESDSSRENERRLRERKERETQRQYNGFWVASHHDCDCVVAENGISSESSRESPRP